MRKVISVIVLFLIPVAGYAQEAKLCHIASAGFYATDGEKGILMDALYGDGIDRTVLASDELNDRLENAKGEFANVRLIYASHFHEDHMKGRSILNHLRANKDAIAIITEQARVLLEAAAMREEEGDRVKSYLIPAGSNLKLEDMPFPATLYGIKHGNRPIENIGITVEVAGKTIMHVGDMADYETNLRSAGVDKVKPDYLLMPYWYLRSTDMAGQINEIFDAKNMIPIHLPPVPSVGIETVEDLQELKNKIYSSADNILKLEDEMACISLE